MSTAAEQMPDFEGEFPARLETARKALAVLSLAEIEALYVEVCQERTVARLAPAPVYHHGELELCAARSWAKWRGEPVAVTKSEVRILALIVANAGTNCSFSEIYACVHGAGFWAGRGDNGYRSNVRSLIKRLRNAFTAIDPNFQAITNIPGFGYCWSAPR